ncbi:MAG: hypothetical protein J6V24_01795 [Clostridia bacterium]|nr:hypothetical protein [Clostridia bacterium]
MTNRDRVRAVLRFEMPDDRLPVIEWASWWDKTLCAWQEQGLPKDLGWREIAPALGLDQHIQYWLPHRGPGCPSPQFNGGPIMEDEDDYEALLPFLYPEHGPDGQLDDMRRLKERHDTGDFPIWFSLDGGFWFPRTLFGIEGHLYSFYDYPELYHRILSDLADYQLRQMERIYEILTPEFMTFGEDMSYNNGPMLSEACFAEFLLPYYRKVVPYIREHGTKVIVDTDGDVTKMIPWLKRAGIEGVLPLERQAGVDLPALREAYPDFLFIGAFDKMTMRRSEEAMRGEFERLLPVMKTGGFIPSVDHQTPPDCPLTRYRAYVSMLKEYAEEAVRRSSRQRS